MSQDRGSASIVLIALSGVLGLLAAVAVSVGGAVVARHRAESAADLAALAAASRWTGGERTACARAREVAQVGGAALTRCGLTGDVAQVHTEVPLPGRLARLGVARGTARAGPAAQQAPPQ